MCTHSFIFVRIAVLELLKRDCVLDTLYFSLLDASFGVLLHLMIASNYKYLSLMFKASSRVVSHSIINFSYSPLCVTHW